MKQQVLVFTDMDGTLLDHNTYSHAAAQPALDALKQKAIPIIPTTSKTFEELLVLRKQIGLNGPFIVENGAAAHIPLGFLPKKPSETQWSNDHWVKQFTSKKHYWLSLLNRVKSEFEGKFNHFSKMTTAQIQEATGLSEEEARRAANRQYSEPVLWLGDEPEKHRFITTMRTIGARPLQGGRFVHISGECDKGMALRWMVNECKRQNPDTEYISIALGDGQNDVAMLEAADYAVRILSPAHAPPTLNKQDNVYTTTQMGPVGWTEALNKILALRL